MAEPASEYVFHYPARSPNGDESDPHIVQVSFNKPLADLKEGGKSFLTELMELPGIEGASHAGRYTLSIGIARTFNAEEVVAEIEESVKRESSNIITLTRPGIATP